MSVAIWNLLIILTILSIASCVGGQKPADEGNRARIEAMYSSYRSSFMGVPEISVKELQDKMTKEPERLVLVDEREQREQAVSIIRGAVPAGEFARHEDDYRKKTVVVYCTIGKRSGEYAKGLIKQGFDAYNLKGGILAWVDAGGEVVGPDGKPTRRVHVYGKKWNILPEGYKAVW